ncbi:MAG: hypothetical protein DMF71_07925 [Acidobacteria bacterium]|nr:MAG: hypothetical protein DMF71_07925 [Acidobacteriota bacterium]
MSQRRLGAKYLSWDRWHLFLVQTDHASKTIHENTRSKSSFSFRSCYFVDHSCLSKRTSAKSDPYPAINKLDFRFDKYEAPNGAED